MDAQSNNFARGAIIRLPNYAALQMQRKTIRSVFRESAHLVAAIADMRNAGPTFPGGVEAVKGQDLSKQEKRNAPDGSDDLRFDSQERRSSTPAAVNASQRQRLMRAKIRTSISAQPSLEEE
jgi:hypothetical protein